MKHFSFSLFVAIALLTSACLSDDFSTGCPEGCGQDSMVDTAADTRIADDGISADVDAVVDAVAETEAGLDSGDSAETDVADADAAETCSPVTDDFSPTIASSGLSGLTNSVPVAFSMSMVHGGAIVSVTIGGDRWSSGTSGAAGTLTIRVIKGTPGTTPPFSDILATVSISGDAVPSVASEIKFDLPTPTAALATGAPVYIEVIKDSIEYNMEVLGAPTGSGGKAGFWAWNPATGRLESSPGEPYVKLVVIPLSC